MSEPELPEDLEALEPKEVERELSARDERAERLFKRWPRLSRPEQLELRRVYRERILLTKYLAWRRKRRK